MPRFSRILRVLLDKGIDLLFEGISSRSEEPKVSLPPRLTKHWVEGGEMLKRSEEMLGRALGEVGGEDVTPHEFAMPTTRGLTRGKRKLLDAMREMAAAEDHLVNKFPDLATEIRKYRKRVEAVVL